MTSPSDAPSPVAAPPPGQDLGLVDALAQLSFLVHNALAEIAAAARPVDHPDPVAGGAPGPGADDERTRPPPRPGQVLDQRPGRPRAAPRPGHPHRQRDRPPRGPGIHHRHRAAARRTGRREASPSGSRVTAGLPDADRQLLAQLAARIVAADADRRGIDLRTLAAARCRCLSACTWWTGPRRAAARPPGNSEQRWRSGLIPPPGDNSKRREAGRRPWRGSRKSPGRTIRFVPDQNDSSRTTSRRHGGAKPG